jgi:hypothetical protein
MNDKDKKSFKELLDTMQDCFKLPHFDKPVLVEWWHKLNTFSLDELQKKIDVFIEQNDRVPSLNDLIVEHKPTIKHKDITPLMLDNNRKRAKELKAYVEALNAK